MLIVDAIAILKAMSESDGLAEEVLGYLNDGMWDEWDCDLLTGITNHGFGGLELQLAAKSGLSKAEFNKEN